MGIENVLNTIKKNNPKADLALVRKAWDWAKQAHKGQIRVSKEPYVNHPLAVASILANLNMDTATISAALLHDTVEDTSLTNEKLKAEFGGEIASLVDGVTKLTKISKVSFEEDPRLIEEEKQALNLRKMFFSMANDIRVIIIKLADRLHNMRTLHHLRLEKQKIIAKETMEIYAPLAHRLGLWQFMWELEDLAFRYLYPTDYFSIKKDVAKIYTRRAKNSQEMVRILEEKFAENKIKVHKIESRTKHLYSVFKKMNRQEKDINEIYDLMAVRVIVSTVAECYAALGIIHGLYLPLPQRIKDYIAKPKPNNYQSLHTTVYGPGQEPIEIQIRSLEMHNIAEYGIAAHWKYKEGIKKSDPQTDKQLIAWTRQLIEWQEDLKDAQEYVYALKMDILNYQVFAFTPKGQVIDLPIGSTPLDFAYRIHTEVGNRCVGSKANGKMVSLDYKIQSGDIIEILTSKNSPGPRLGWLNICHTSQAKHKIRQWLKKEKREENITRGKSIIEREIKKFYPDVYVSLPQIVQQLNFHAEEDLLAALGYGEVSASQIIFKLKGEKKEDAKELEEKLTTEETSTSESGKAIVVEGLDQLLVRFGRCCLPVYGDDVFGYITVSGGITIHRQDCTNANHMQTSPERIVKVNWDPRRYNYYLYTVEIEVEAADRNGLLRDIMNVFTEQKVSVKNVNAKSYKNSKALVHMAIDISSLKNLERVLRMLRLVKGVLEAKRITHLNTFSPKKIRKN